MSGKVRRSGCLAVAAAGAFRKFLLFYFRNIEFGEALLYFVAYTVEFRIDEFRRADGVRRVVETDVQAFAHFAGECRTTFVGTAANGDDIIPFLVEVGVDVGRNVVADVDTRFLHYFYGFRIDLLGRFRTTRKHFERCVERLEKAVCHLAAAAVACAKDQNSHIVCVLVIIRS